MAKIITKEKGKKDLIQEIPPSIGFALIIASQNIDLNSAKIKILIYLFKNKEKEVSISQISKDLKIDYKNTWRYVKELHDYNFINLNPETPSQGKKVLVSINKEYKLNDGKKTIILKKKKNKKGQDSFELILGKD